MSKQQLLLLCLCHVIVATIGNSLVTFLPVYALELGADTDLSGLYLSLAFMAVSTGTIASGWLSDRLQRRKALLVASAIVSALAYLLMREVTTLGQLALITSVAWFMGGVNLIMVNTLAGLFAGPDERGKIFGILASTGALATVIAGLFSGPIVDRWGYDGLFTGAMALFVLQIGVGLLLDDKAVARVETQRATAREPSLLANRTYMILFAASTLAFVAAGEALLGRPLAMNMLGFDATSLASALTFSGLITFILPTAVGWLSDRMPRIYLMILCFGAGLAGLLVLAGANALWHFWVSATFMALVNSSLSVGSALVTDFVPKAALGRGLAWFNATTWIGYMIGFAVTGTAIRVLGVSTPMIIGAVLSGAAILLLKLVRQPQAAEQAQPAA